MAALEVIIIGGGLAGACLANGLLNWSGDSVHITVFERDEAYSERGGYQIRLGAHALRGFKACLIDSQYEDLLSCFGRSGGVVSSAPCIYNPSDLRVLVDLSKAPLYEKSAPISRSRLREFLQAPLRQRQAIEYGKKFVRYEVLEPRNENSQSRIRAHCADGSHQDCDVLISAEGSSSRVNKQIGLNNILEDHQPGHGSYLGKCHLPQEVLRTIPRQIVQKGTIYTGNAKAMVFAAVYLPDANQSASASPARRSFDASASEHLLSKGEDYDQDQASLFLAVGWFDGPSGSEAAQVLDKKALMRQKLHNAGFHQDFHRLVDAVDADALTMTPFRFADGNTPVDWRKRLLLTERSKPESSPSIANSRVWLMGDAIHPMLPSRGMGANNAIEDAADILPRLLKLAEMKAQRAIVTDEQVGRQLHLYEAYMMPRAFAWVRKSRNQQLPNLESVKGRCIVLSLRVVLSMAGVVVDIMKLFGWQPKDDAPDLP